jgi:hypothetical protein
MTCNISTGSLVIDGSAAQCGNASISIPPSGVTVIGKTTRNIVAIRNTSVTVILSGVDITSANPFVVSGSGIAYISLVGHNKVNSTNSPAFECTENSELFFSTPGNGDLSAIGVESSGIGTNSIGTCDSIEFYNGTYVIDAGIGTAIGASDAPGTSSTLTSLQIDDGTFTLTGTTGIGSGTVHDNGNSTLDQVRIITGTFTINAIEGIGSGPALNGHSYVSSIIIWDGTFHVDASAGSGLGAGPA